MRLVAAGLQLPAVGLGNADLKLLPGSCRRQNHVRTKRHAAEAKALAGERRYRIWLVYLAGCAHALERGWVSVYQMLTAKASDAAVSPLPWIREYMHAPLSAADEASLRLARVSIFA